MSSERQDALPESDSQSVNCVICLGVPKFPTGRPDTCKHVFCFLCINNWVKRRSECPLCKRRTRFIVKTDADGKETKIKVRQRTEAEFSHELADADARDGPEEEVDITVAFAICRICHRSDNADRLLLCDGTIGQEYDGSPIRCNAAYHCYCLPEPLAEVPRGRWYCPFCIDMRETQRGVYNRRYVAPRSRSTSSYVSYVELTDDDQPGPSRGRRTSLRRRVVVDDDESFSEDMSTSGENGGNDGDDVGAVDDDEADFEESEGSCTSGSPAEESGDKDNWEDIDRYVLAVPGASCTSQGAQDSRTVVRRRARRKKSKNRKTKKKGKAQPRRRKSTEKRRTVKKRKSTRKRKTVSRDQRRLATAIGINLETNEGERKRKKNRWESLASDANAGVEEIDTSDESNDSDSAKSVVENNSNEADK